MYPSGAAYQEGKAGAATVFAAEAVIDAIGCDAAPGAVAVFDGRVLAAGPTDDVVRTVGGDARIIRLPGRMLVPGMVNAHTHLELTALGPRPYAGDFVGWLKQVRGSMPNSDDPMHESNLRWAIQSAVIGARRSLEAGVRVVGDISKFTEVHQTVGRAGLRGVGFVELFGLGPPFDQPALQRIGQFAATVTADYRLGLQPHAPYSAGPGLLEAAIASGLPACTHLAETTQERTFITSAAGPFRDLLVGIGKWDDAFGQWYNKDQSPVQWMSQYLRRSRWLCAHCNYVDDDDIALLAGTHTSVAYCPRATTYFGHLNHRYGDMLEAGVNVALGTDSILCHGTLSIVDEMRYLHQRDHANPGKLLAMATVNGMTALGLDPRDATFGPGALPGIVALRYDSHTPTSGMDALRHVLAHPHSPAIQRLL